MHLCKAPCVIVGVGLLVQGSRTSVFSKQVDIDEGQRGTSRVTAEGQASMSTPRATFDRKVRVTLSRLCDGPWSAHLDHQVLVE